jgi:putative sterol carrier protein
MTQEQPLPNSIKEVMEGMPQAFQPDKAAGVNATLEEGETDGATVTINSPSDIWLKITRRELDGATAFMSGQFTFTGDMGVLMQMGGWFGQA